jgi:4-amino-4-deoxy-L-arabinose transferase-like glycosyltransferase
MAPAPPGGRDASVPAQDAGLVLLLAFLSLSAFAWARDLWDADEGRYAAVALDMLRAGDWVTPREAGMRFMDKPPLLYWMEMVAFSVLGATPFAARLPCLLGGAVLATATFLFAAAWTRDRRTSWFCAGAAATSAGVVGLSRVAPQTDMLLAAATTVAILGAHRALSSDAARHRVVLGAGIGLALLSKGALGVLVPFLVAVAWIAVGAGMRRVARVAFSPLAWVVALAVAAPWYALVEARNPGYLAHFFVYEHVGRYTRPGHRNFAPLWLYLPVLIAMLLPWTPFLLRARLPAPVDVGGSRPLPAERLAWAWAAVLLLFFSLGRNKLHTYVFPATPPLLVLAGAGIAAVVSGRRPGRAAACAFGAGALVAFAGAAIATGWAGDRGLVAPGMRPVGLPMALASVPMLLVPLAFRATASVARRGAALFLAASLAWWGLDLAAARADPLHSARALAETLAREARPGDAIVSYDRYPQGVRFYADVDVRIAGNQREIVPPWSDRDGRGRLLTKDELKGLWHGPSRVLLVAREVDARAEFPTARFVAGPLAGAQRHDLWVVSNR